MMILIMWQTRRLTRPIRDLISVTIAIFKGEDGKGLIPRSGDEIDQLTHAINQFSEQFTRYKTEITQLQDKLKPQSSACPEGLRDQTDSADQNAEQSRFCGQGRQAEKRVLLVDGDTSYRRMFSSMIQTAGFEVDEASAYEQALAKISVHRPDLIILDAIIPGVDGFETCVYFKSRADLADIPVIMVTHLNDIESVNHAFEVGVTDFIVKPVNYSILIHRLDYVLRTNQSTAELSKSKQQLSSVQRMARLGYWRWDPLRDYFEISENLAELCGIDLAHFEMTLEAFIQWVHPKHREVVKNMIITAPYSNLEHSIEYQLQIAKSGSLFVIQELVRLNEQGKCVIEGIVQDITHRKVSEKQIHRLAYFDALTGLASRTYYHERIEMMIRTAYQRNQRFAFVFLDLDSFKDINDSFGHDVGDQFLKTISERLQNVVRDIDFVARLGGDEFCLLLTDIHSEAAVGEVAMRCLQSVNQVLSVNEEEIRPRVSIGIAIYPKDGANEIDLMKAADAAMYNAKQTGKQRYVFYSAEMANLAIARLQKEQMLRDAFEKEQFVLHYQPQISMQTGRIVGMEALVRWQLPDRLIPPIEFISLAEQLGLIVDLGNLVLKMACHQIAAWHHANLPFLRVAVNIAPLHFQEPTLIHTIQTLLLETAIPASSLELEITESSLQTEGHLEVFNQLRALGIKITIDDFGTGYSCLASLKKIPLDYLKIDKIFIDDVLENRQTALLLGVIIGLANALGYTLVAEGVETRDQAIAIFGMGCYLIQGNQFSVPVEAEKIPELLDVDFSFDFK